MNMISRWSEQLCWVVRSRIPISTIPIAYQNVFGVTAKPELRRCVKLEQTIELLSFHPSPRLKTSAIMETFFQMMAKYPGNVKQAHTQIDAYIHEHRILTLEDRKYIPVVDCIMKEVLRYAFYLLTILRLSLF